MDCPRCNNEMILGKAKVKGSFVTEFYLTFHPARQDVWFENDNGEHQLVLRGNIPEEALRCTKCLTLILPTQPQA